VKRTLDPPPGPNNQQTGDDVQSPDPRVVVLDAAGLAPRTEFDSSGSVEQPHKGSQSWNWESARRAGGADAFVLDRQSQRSEPLSCVTAGLRNQTLVWSAGGAGICARFHRQEGAVSEEEPRTEAALAGPQHSLSVPRFE
jgi:hypothetical protein